LLEAQNQLLDSNEQLALARQLIAQKERLIVALKGALAKNSAARAAEPATF
jgi:hypothetical protein